MSRGATSPSTNGRGIASHHRQLARFSRNSARPVTRLAGLSRVQYRFPAVHLLMSAFGAEDAHEEEESLADELADVKMSADEVAVAAGAGAGEAEGAPDSARSAGAAIRVEDAVKLEYCPNCSMPPEYCEFNMPEVFGKCLPWILANCREALSKATLAKVTGEELKEEEDEGEVCAGFLSNAYMNMHFMSTDRVQRAVSAQESQGRRKRVR